MKERKKTLYVSDLCIDILLSSYNPIARLLKYKYIIVNGAIWQWCNAQQNYCIFFSQKEEFYIILREKRKNHHFKSTN